MKKHYINLFTTVVMILIAFNTIAAQDVTSVTPDEPIKDESALTEYRRSSIYSVLIKHSKLKFGTTIDSVFMSIPTSDKFNNHDIAIKSFESTAVKAKRRGKKKDASNSVDIDNFIKDNNIPAQLVAKWFNRNPENGAFNIDLIHERGYYDASQDAISQAENNIYGKSFLADAGEELIGKTFMLINDITFSDTGEKTAKASKWMKLAGEIAGELTDDDDIADLTNTAADAVNEIDGFGVNITSRLYCLDWCDKTLDHFYTHMWHDSKSVDANRKQIFDTTSFFKLNYIGEITTTARNISIKSLAQRSKENQLTKVCARAIDKSIVELQREYEQFRVNVPIGKVYEDGTVDVAIGLKEGLNEKSEYEVLMKMENEDKTITYDKIGQITPIKGKIWDNRFGALEEYKAMKEDGEKVEDPDGKEGDPSLITSTFKITSGKNKIIEGCLVREVTIKR